MMKQKSISAVLSRLVVFVAVMAVLLLVVIQAITRPVGGATDSYAAMFTDVSGLRTGDDVRMFGLQVGKVSAIRVDRDRAVVAFTVQRGRAVYDASVVAIRYQSLTGQRYVDIRQPDRPTSALRPGTTIGAEHTVPSFDITTLFNGLEPVLAEFSPAALNQFMASMLAIIEGTGDGIGPALDSIAKLSTYVTDRQAVISTIFANLRTISDEIGGRSPHLITMLSGLQRVFAALEAKFDSLIDFADTAPSMLGPLNSLMATLGFSSPNNPDLEKDMRLLFPDPKAALDLLGKLPGLLQSLDALLPPLNPAAGEVTSACSKGQAPVPAAVNVLIAGQRISVCNG